jgi:succinoglycan biosynthesis transport protein ExoP
MFEAPGYAQTVVAGRSDATPDFGNSGDFNFSKFWSVLWRGKWIILLTTVTAFGLAVAFIKLVPHRYTATTQILVDPMDLRAALSDVAPTIPQSDAAVLQVESQSRVIGSDNVLSRVVASEGLDHDPEFAHGPTAADHGALTALDYLKKHLTIRRPERTFVIEVDVTSEDPAKAARIANAIAQAYLVEQTQARSDAARQVSQALSSRLKELQDRVRVAENRVEAYKASHNIIGVNGALVGEQTLSESNTQLNGARARTAEARARLDQIENFQKSNGAVGAFPEAVQSATITMLRSQYNEIMRREAEQKSTLGDRHPAVIEIEAQAEKLHRSIEEEVNRIAISARAEYQRAKDDEAELSRRVDALQNNTLSTNESLVGLRELERDVQANRTVFESFLVRSRETQEQEQVDTKNIRIISRADLPLTRSWPPSGVLVALAAMMMGAACGTGIVILRALNETGVERREEAEAQPSRLSAAVKKLWRGQTPMPQIPVIAELPPVDVTYGLAAVENPNSRFAREIRKISDVLRENHRTRANPSVLVVASCDEDDTTTVALSLAAATAATQRVLLIDADLQRRTLSALDSEASEGGLVDVATGRYELSDLIVHDRDTSINLLPFVAADSRRDRSISDTDVKQAFDKTRRFDMVIVAAVDFDGDPSTRFFAGLVDHIVLVARPVEEDRRAAERFMSRLGPDALKVRGAVLTGVEAS